MNIEKTLQERLDDEKDFLNKELFSLLISYGCNANSTMTNVLSLIRTLDRSQCDKFASIMLAAKGVQTRATWKDPHRVDKQQGAWGRLIAKRGGGNE